MAGNGRSLGARIRTVGESIASLREAVTLVAGDFNNLLALGETRYNLSTGEIVTEAVPEQATLSDALPSCVEICAAGCSRRQVRYGMLHFFARPDRAFISGDAGSYLGDACTARYMSSPTSTTLPSDHAALQVCVAPTGAIGIFIESMAEAIPLITEAAVSSFQALTDTVRAMRGVVREIRLSLVPPCVSLLAWQAHWLAAARQAWARHDDEEVRRWATRAGNQSGLQPTAALRAEVDDDAIHETIRWLRRHQISVDMSTDVQRAATEEETRPAWAGMLGGSAPTALAT